MATVRDIFVQMDQWAPFETQMDFDNAGFLVGRGEREVRKILVSLDITEPVVDEAAEWGADLIVAHHPVIFHPVKRLTDETPTGRTLLALAERGIAAICAHTNLDAAWPRLWNSPTWSSFTRTAWTAAASPTASAGWGTSPPTTASPPGSTPPL